MLTGFTGLAVMCKYRILSLILLTHARPHCAKKKKRFTQAKAPRIAHITHSLVLLLLFFRSCKAGFLDV